MNYSTIYHKIQGLGRWHKRRGIDASCRGTCIRPRAQTLSAVILRCPREARASKDGGGPRPGRMVRDASAFAKASADAHHEERGVTRRNHEVDPKSLPLDLFGLFHPPLT